MSKLPLLLAHLLLTHFLTSDVVFSIPLEAFYSLGSTNSENSTDDYLHRCAGHPEPVHLQRANLTVFSQEYQTLYVYTYGYVTLGGRYSTYPYDIFPSPIDTVYIAPFWVASCQQNQLSDSRIYFHETEDVKQLERAQALVRSSFCSQADFVPTSLFIATWYHIEPYYSRFGEATARSNGTNTFQCVLMTNGVKSFAVFLYADGLMQWTATNVGSYPIAGYDANDDIHFFNHPDSRTRGMINITKTSNVDIPGLWIFRLDSEEEASAQCRNQASSQTSVCARDISISVVVTVIVVAVPYTVVLLLLVWCLCRNRKRAKEEADLGYETKMTSKLTSNEVTAGV